MTALQKAYQKEVNRIMRIIERVAKEGYYLPANHSFKKELMLERPTRKQLERLKSIKTVDIDLWVVKNGERGWENSRAQSKQRKSKEKRKKKPDDFRNGGSYPISPEPPKEPIERGEEREPEETTSEEEIADIIITHFRQEHDFSKYAYPKFIEPWLVSSIAEFGKVDTARAIEKARQDGVILAPEDAYKDDKIEAFLRGIANFIGIDYNMMSEGESEQADEALIFEYQDGNGRYNYE